MSKYDQNHSFNNAITRDFEIIIIMKQLAVLKIIVSPIKLTATKVQL